MASSAAQGATQLIANHDPAAASANVLTIEEQCARDVTGCSVWSYYRNLNQDGDVDAIASHFQAACLERDFISILSNAGFTNPTFHPNTNMKEFPVREKFATGLKSLVDSSALGVVFHGTYRHNINDILQNGLDPSRRKGQAYGPGEYFSKEPGLSVCYCKGGLEMLVFVVVLPSTVPAAARVDTEENDKDTKTKNQPRHAYHAIPPDYVVVENNNHQIPIGTMKFDSVDRSVVSRSQRRRTKLMALTREVLAKSQVKEETSIKAKIIQDLITNKVDTASRHYEKHRAILKEVSKREISWYVHQNVDEEVICFYFEGLPEPLGPEEIANTKLQSLDDATKQEQEAKERLDAAQKAASSGLHVAQRTAKTDADVAKLQLAMERLHHANISTSSRASLVGTRQREVASQDASPAVNPSPNPQEDCLPLSSAAPSLASSSASTSSPALTDPGANEADLAAGIISALACTPS